MSKLRLLFVKEAQAAYISHLDLLRTMQRVFPRAGLEISHSHGFHPHPIISLVLPLPVGQSSDCELMEFEVTEESDGTGFAQRLNPVMPCGLRVLDCYEAKRPARELTLLRADIEWDYDDGVPHGAEDRLRELFARPELIIQKRTKRKELADVDIVPLLRSIELETGEKRVLAHVTVQAQNPGLNPQLLEKAIARYLPELTPDFTRVRRREVLDAEGNVFR